MWNAIRKELNFYRVHILFFTFTPLIFSAIFYASNGHYQISYIDSLFNCVSAMTVCGLATVDLSSLTAWQQTILFFQMCLGSPVVVSWVMVYLRKYYFAKKFEHIIAAAKAKAIAIGDAEKVPPPWTRRISTLLSRRSLLSPLEETSREGSLNQDEKPKKRGFMRKLQPDMIRRMDHPPQLVNPSGWISEGAQTPKPRSPEPEVESVREEQDVERPRHLTFTETLVSSPKPISDEPSPSSPSPSHLRTPGRRLSDPGRISPLPSSPITSSFPRSDTIALGMAFPRTQTVEFAPDVLPRRARGTERPPVMEYEESVNSQDRRSTRGSTRRGSWIPHETLTQNMTAHTYPSGRRTKHSGFGGFPMPHEIVRNLFTRLFPKLQQKLTRSITLPRTTTLASNRGEIGVVGAKPAPYISFTAIVGRNSAFQQLTKEQQDELGGVEYRALKALLWIVAGYHIGVQLIAFTVIAPYMAQARWAESFVPPMQHKKLTSTWYSLFQVVSAYTNTGMSLVDQSMVPFQRAYAMIIFLVLLVLAGNTAFPIFLRFMIWVLAHLVPTGSRASETLHFLLDHPRRCFIYLFPSHQTWFLLTVVLTLNLTDWFFFMVLDIGNPAIETIPLNVRFIIGLLQAIAVRAAGFGTVALSALAPAVKVLYLIMMYISVYPIAMSVRSTNVYEEQSLGVFREDADSDDEDNFQPTGESRVTVWSRYLAMHARRQLAFDMWWLGLAVFLVCIIERHNIDLEANATWFNIFSVVFELVSAYGTVGLSLGTPTDNFSFSGAFTPLSKLIVCFVMIRGRHRGLPVAIDRAVMLPMEFNRNADAEPENVEEKSDVPSISTGHEKPSEDAEWRRRKNAQRRNTEEMSVAEIRKNAAKLDQDASLV